jgi:hypothetical protein
MRRSFMSFVSASLRQPGSKPTLRQSASAGLRRSANTPQIDEIFQVISGGRNAFGGFGHPGGELASPSNVLRGKDCAQVRD